jgi:copper chaperone
LQAVAATYDYSEQKGDSRMATIKIKGMSCQHCVMAVKKALSEIAGITNLDVDLTSGEATFDEIQPVDLAKVKERIKKAGYEIV